MGTEAEKWTSLSHAPSVPRGKGTPNTGLQATANSGA